MVKQATKNTQLVLHTMPPNELNSVIVHFTTANQTSLVANQVVAEKFYSFRQNLYMSRVVPAQGKLVLQQLTYFLLYSVTPA